MKIASVFITSIMWCSLAFAGQSSPLITAINARCAAKWGDNYRMQKYCRNKEMEGIFAFNAYVAKHKVNTPAGNESPQGKIVYHCWLKWTDEHGRLWSMVAYCIRQQDEALRSL